MKEENKHTWEQLEAQWRKRLHEQEEPAPAFNWEQLDAKSARPMIPLWQKVVQSPVAWAAVLGLSIGLNWQQVDYTPTSMPVFEVSRKRPIERTVPSIIQNSDPQEAKIVRVEEESQPALITPNPVQTAEPVFVAELPQVSKADEEEVVFVRIDIDPVEENHIQSAVEVNEKPIKRKRNLLGQILRQVIVREAGGWRNIANSNDKLTEGIHQVANTVIRTEQTVKQTLQFQ